MPVSGPGGVGAWRCRGLAMSGPGDVGAWRCRGLAMSEFGTWVRDRSPMKAAIV